MRIREGGDSKVAESAKPEAHDKAINGSRRCLAAVASSLRGEGKASTGIERARTDRRTDVATESREKRRHGNHHLSILSRPVPSRPIPYHTIPSHRAEE